MGSTRVTFVWSLLLVAFCLAILGMALTAVSGSVLEVVLTPVARNCTYYATFQSHNQKAVQNDNGIFISYSWEFDLESWYALWRLARSTDNGTSFRTIYTSPYLGSNAPCIETDRENNILLVCTDYNDPAQPFLYHRFLASRDYQDPEITRINSGASGKFAMYHDRSTDKVFLFNHYGRLFVLNATTGRLIEWKDVVAFTGRNATTQYPHICMDDNHTLHHAWTTSHLQRYLYWDIHYAKSNNEGKTWQTANGTRLYCPFKPDQSGASDQIILPDEFEVHTWLSSMIAKDGKVHFAYLAQTPDYRQHYVRIDLTTGRIDKRIYPVWRGENISIQGLDGFFSTGPSASDPLYYIGRANYSHIAALVSYDNGDTWHDAAFSEKVPNAIYSIGGCRQVTPLGIIGSFTSQYGTRGDVYFFRIAVQEPMPIPFIQILAAMAFCCRLIGPGWPRSP